LLTFIERTLKNNFEEKEEATSTVGLTEKQGQMYATEQNKKHETTTQLFHFLSSSNSTSQFCITLGSRTL
jgi:hypothetical protein